ncbi:MAG: HEAT repeat domain-containing protein [Desulfobacterales bacterium]|nr:HEAT repeat domain-containing protein [Desulfobacterales bacterium]
MKNRKFIIAALVLIVITAGAVTLIIRQGQKPEPVPVVIKTEPETRETAPSFVSGSEEKPDPVRLRFGPKHGQTIAFRFESKTDAEIDFGFITPAISGAEAGKVPEKGARTPVSMNASGELYLKYFDLEPGRWQVAALISNLDYKINSQMPLYESAIEYPFTLKMISTGFLSDFEFVKGIPAEAGQFVQQILFTMQTAFPKEPKTEWGTKETDMTGRYRTAYALKRTEPETAGISKQKTEYLELKAAKSAINDSVSASEISIEKSETDITVPKKGPWIISLAQQESTVTHSGNYNWAETGGSFSARRIEKDVSKKFPKTFDAFLADMKSGKYIKSKYYATDANFNQLGANISMDDALAVYDKLKNSGQSNAGRYAEKFVVNYLRQHPGASSELIKVMNSDPKREQLDQSTQLIMWRLITEAGHTEAQKAFADAAINPEYSDLTQWRAIAYSDGFENPEPLLAETMWDFYNGIETPKDRRERDMKTSSLYSLGSMGSDEKVNPETKQKVSRLLSDHLKNTPSPGEQIVTLAAVGNYGGEDMIDDIEPLFGSQNEKVRAAAFNALRRMDAPEAVQTLAKHYEKETSPEVRVTAAATLSRMPPTAEGVNLACKTVLKTDAPGEQEFLARVVGKNLEDYPENESTLRELLKKNPDNKVKQEIYKYVVPK